MSGLRRSRCPAKYTGRGVAPHPIFTKDWRKQYEKGYETYREAVKKTQPDALFLVRAIGCELCLLKEKKEENLEKQILEELPVQIERVVELAVSNRRMNVGVLKDLQKKLEELEAWTELQELVKEYRTKIEEYL